MEQGERLKMEKTVEEAGVINYEKMINGFHREWYEYTPDAICKEDSKTSPLVFCFGGYGCTAENFIVASKWCEVAEARGFIALFPAPVPQPDPRRRVGKETVNPAWNIWDQQEYPNDIGLVSEIIKDIQTRKNIDESRIYATGHSLGGILTQRLGLHKPELFAAIAPCSSNLNGVYLDIFKDPGISNNTVVPINLLGGEHDFAGGELKPNSCAEDTVQHWLVFNKIPGDALPVRCKGNRYNADAYVSSEGGYPLLTYTLIRNSGHEFSPETAWKIWDDFLQKYRRNPDGSIVYTET